VRIVTIGTAQQAARDEQHDAQARAIVAGRRLVGMAVAECAFRVLELVLVRRIWRDAGTEVVPASRFERLHRRHHGPPGSDLAVEGAADHIPLLLRREADEIDRIAYTREGEG